MQKFLADVNIVDLSQYIPGPFASLMLSDMGANVIKIEPPGGDEMLRLGPKDTDGHPVFYNALNAGKSVAQIDLKSASGKQNLMDLLETADILIEGFRPGVMARLGFDYETLSASHHRLIYCSISGYGPTGPLANVASHDGNYLATSGIMDRNGDLKPVFYDPPVADMTGALFAAMAILGALHGRASTNKGVFIDLGLADALMPLQLLQIADWGANGTVPKRNSNYLNGGAAYYQVYRTVDDRAIMLGSVEPKFWANFCNAANRADWIDRQHESFPQHALIAEVSSFFQSRSLDDLQHMLVGVDCCFSPVLDLGEALTSKQTAERDLVCATEEGMQALFPAKFNNCRAPNRPALKVHSFS